MDIVEITCYNKTVKMERQAAIELYADGVLACDGSEQERYSNILAQLISGYKICTDEI